MAEEAVQNILEGLKIHNQRVQAQRQLEIEAQRAQADTEYKKAEVEQRKAELEQSKKVQDAQLALAQKAADLTHLSNLQQIGVTSAQTGILPPGVQSASAPAFTTSGAPTLENLNNANTFSQNNRTLTLPSGEQLTIPTPEAYAQHQATIAEILEGPKRRTQAELEQAKTEREVETTKVKEAADTQRQIALENVRQAAELQRTREMIAGENLRNSVSQGTQMKIAMLPYSFFNNLSADQRNNIVQPSIDAMLNGDMSTDMVHKQFNEKGMAGAGLAVTGQFMANGGVPPTQKQVDFKQQVAPIVSVLPLIQQYIGMLPDTKDTTVGTVASHTFGITHPDWLNSSLDSLYKRIEFNIATVAKTLGGDQGQRLQKALLEPAQGGYMPNKYKTKQYNINNFNTMLDIVNNAIDKTFGSMPVAQRAQVKKSLGLDKITYMKSLGTQQQTPATNSLSDNPQIQLSPAAVDLMKKYNLPIQ